MVRIDGTSLKVQNLREGQGTRRITIIASDESTLDGSWQVVEGTNIIIVGGRGTKQQLTEYMLTPMAAKRFPGGIGGGPEQTLRQWLGIKRTRRGRPPSVTT